MTVAALLYYKLKTLKRAPGPQNVGMDWDGRQNQDTHEIVNRQDGGEGYFGDGLGLGGKTFP